MTAQPLLVLATVFLLAACKKIEYRDVPVEVEKKTSWTEIKRFSGTERVFLSSARSANALYFQQPFHFTELRNADVNSGMTVYGASLPTDLRIRIPVSAAFYVAPYPYSPTAIVVRNNESPVTSPSGGFYDVKQFDSTCTGVQTSYLNLFKCMTVNSNGTLLLAYENNRTGQPFTFLMLKIKALRDYPYVDTVFSRKVAVPRTTLSYVRFLKAVDDYFLLDLSSEGIFKIKEDGSFRRVHSPAVVDAFYAWKGRVFAHAEWSKLLISEDNGDSFQSYSGGNTAMTLSQYTEIKDSLVGAYRDQLFTLRWEGNNYSMRFLKNDGLESTTVNGVEILRDSVYAATTSGLYVKPLARFFDSK